MPSIRCGVCARFLNSGEASKCSKCNVFYHRGCVLLPITDQVPPSWRCPECTKHVIRDNRPDTPVRGRSEVTQVEEFHPAEGAESTPLGCVLDASSSFIIELSKELRLFRAAFHTEMRSILEEFQQFRTEIREALTSNEIQLNSLNSRVDTLELKLGQKVASDKFAATIAELNQQLNERDQEILLNDIEISGVTESKDESVLHIVKTVGAKLGIIVEDSDIVHAERVGSNRRNRVTAFDGSIEPQRPRKIVVRLVRRETRDSLLHSARVRRGLTTGHLHIAGPSRNIYINERLTKTNRRLFYNARQTAAMHKWKYVWTREGKILARKDDNLKAERIRSDEDICAIIGQL